VTTGLVVFVIATVVAVVATPLVRALACRLGIVDEPDGFRKLHGKRVPLLGGVAVYLAFLLSMAATYVLAGKGNAREFLHSGDLIAIAVGATVVLAIGAWDDARGMRARWKFLGMLLVALGMYAAGFRIGAVSNPFGSAFDLSWLALPVTLFWFLGCMNAINLIDGMDGLATGVVFFASATLFATSVLFGNAAPAVLCAALAGAALGFLFFNFHPATIFLGDSGSLLLGFLLACVGLRGSQKSHMVVALLIPVVALGLPIFDTALAIVRRRFEALPMSFSDRHHVHHKLLEMGLSHRAAVLILYAACGALGCMALLMAAVRSGQAAVVLVALAALSVPALRVISRHELQLIRKSFGDYTGRRRAGVQCRTAAHVAAASMPNDDSAGELWETFAGAAEKLQLEEATLTVFGRDKSGPRTYHWRLGQTGGSTDCPAGGSDEAAKGDRPADTEWTVAFPLHRNGTMVGRLYVRKYTSGDAVARELPEALHELSLALGMHLERVRDNAGHTVSVG
jgi:UDP-GlcNAc:undecaprenyl-phosphate GlcNAc-1-phosphate transferase